MQKMSNKLQKWKELSREIAFQKYSRKIEKVIYQLPNGEQSDFYIKEEGPATGILALTKDLQVILVRQFRPGPNEILAELPGGYIGKNQTPKQVAERELMEETGYKGKAKIVAQVYDCAYSTMNRYCVVITDCKKVTKQKLDRTEFVEVVLVSLYKFRQLLRSGKMTDVEVGYLGLDFLNLL